MSKIIFVLVSLLWIGGCKNKIIEIPFPAEEVRISPSTRATQFSNPKKLIWTDQANGVRPLIRKFEFDKLPVKIYDSTGFLKFTKPPQQVHFDLDSLPTRPFNFYALPSKPLKFHTQILEQPKQIKTAHPHIVNSASGLTYEFGDPLVGTHITCVFKDRTGLLWITNEQGLYRYDGEIMSLIISGALVPNVFSMLEDRLGKIWIGTQGNGIIILDTKAGIFKQISTAEGLANDAVARMVIDQTGRFWITESSRNSVAGIDIIDADSLIIRHISKNEGLFSENVTGIVRDSSNNIWIGNLQGGVNIINLKNSTIKSLNHSNGLNTNSISSLLVDKKNRVWLAGMNAEINMVDLQQRSATQYYRDPKLAHVMIWGLMEDNKGNIWTETYGLRVPGKGIFVIDPLNSRFKNIGSSDAISSLNVESIIEDGLGQVWVGTLNGLNMFNKAGKNIEHLGKSEITSLVEDSKGLIWICTSARGIEILDRATGLVRTFDVKHGLANDSLENIIEQNGELLITSNGGLDIIDSARKTIRHFGKKQGLGSDLIETAFKDTSGRIWLCSIGSTIGLDILNEKRGTVEHIEFEDELKQAVIFDIKQDRLGRIWFVTNISFTGIIDPTNKTFRQLINAKEADRRSDMELLLDEEGKMWIGSSQGIYIVSAAQDSLRRISTREGLLSNEIFSLNEYAGRIYAGTRSGLSIITPFSVSSPQWKIESYGNAEGIRKLVNTISANSISKKGNFLWGDMGITFLNNLRNEKIFPPVYISGIDIFNQSQNFIDKNWSGVNEADTIWTSKKDSFYFKRGMPSDIIHSFPQNAKWDSVVEPYNLPVNLQLPYDNNYLQFHYVQAGLGSQDTTLYQYILEGADKKWSDITNNTYSQNYLNLPPGDYIFKVSARGKSGQWATPAAFSFSVMPPWWQTWWAYTIFGLLFRRCNCRNC